MSCAVSCCGSAPCSARLDELARELPYIPVSTATWRRAAALWASVRSAGIVTAPPDALDGDVLIAAQAIEEDASVVTTNAKHFEALSAPTFAWSDVPLAGGPGELT